ncbi:hypothetical protein [Streptomyces tropicalis]
MPGRLTAAGLAFTHPQWEKPPTSLVQRARPVRAASRRARKSSRAV